MEVELQKIINAAFIYESCPQRRRHAEWRKEQLTKRLILYIEEKLSESAESKISNGLGESSYRLEPVP